MSAANIQYKKVEAQVSLQPIGKWNCNIYRAGTHDVNNHREDFLSEIPCSELILGDIIIFIEQDNKYKEPLIRVNFSATMSSMCYLFPPLLLMPYDF